MIRDVSRSGSVDRQRDGVGVQRAGERDLGGGPVRAVAPCEGDLGRLELRDDDVIYDVTIPAGTLTNDGDLRCDARYVFSRFSRGDYPEELAPGGFVEAQVLRIVLFESTP